MNLRGYLVTVKGPCPAYIYHFGVYAKDLYTAKGFIDEYKRFLDEIDKEYQERFRNGEFDIIFDSFGLRKVKIPKIDIPLQVTRRGRGKKSKYVVKFLVTNSVFYYYIGKVKDPVYRFLRENSLAVKRAAEYIYLLPENYLPDLVALAEKTNRLLGYLNDFFLEYWERVRDDINDMLRKYQIDFVLPEYPPKTIPKLQLELIPARYSKDEYVYWRERDPLVAKYYKETVDRFLEYVLKSFFNVVEVLVKGRRKMKKTIARLLGVEQIIRDLGLEPLFREALADARAVIENNKAIEDLDVWMNNVRRKVLSWDEEHG